MEPHEVRTLKAGDPVECFAPQCEGEFVKPVAGGLILQILDYKTDSLINCPAISTNRLPEEEQ